MTGGPHALLSWEHQPGNPGDWRAAQIRPGWHAVARNAVTWTVTIIGDTRTGPYPFAQSVELPTISAAKDWTERYLRGETVQMRQRRCGPPSLTWADAIERGERDG